MFVFPFASALMLQHFMMPPKNEVVAIWAMKDSQFA
jgi:hypothetical protein